jgi:outer membrane lipoprotein carrier protein
VVLFTQTPAPDESGRLQRRVVAMWSYLRKLSLAMLVLCIGGVSLGAAAGDNAATLSKILDGLEKRYAGPGFSAKFFQESMLKAMQISDTAEGSLTVKRPGKMRWEYTIPDVQTVVSDGRTMWIYRPADNQVMVGKAPTFFSGGKGAGFLSDIRQVRKSFAIEVLKAENEAYYRLRLTPRKSSPDLADVILSVKKTNFQVDQVITHNAYGDETQITLNEYQFNLDPKDTLFTFKPPEGVDVVHVDQP